MASTTSRMASLSQKYKDNYIKILESALEAVRPEILLKKNVRLTGEDLKIGNRKINLRNFEKIHTIGIGKGAQSLYNGLSEVLGEKIDRGLIISNNHSNSGLNNIKFSYGDHPIPGKNSFLSTEKLKHFILNIRKNDLVIALITGGSSAMIISPPKKISIKEISNLNVLLISSGASIHEINCVRKHLSTLKGGRLAKMIYPAKIISLLISDVTGSDHGIIGSGPFSGDSSTFQEALDILTKYSLEKKVGKEIIDYLNSGVRGRIDETPGLDDPIFKNNISLIIGKNSTALEAAKKKAEQLAFKTEILTSEDSGNIREASKRYGLLIKNRLKEKPQGTKSELIISGGEFTVNVKGNGKGGRVQEFLLLLLDELKDISEPFFVAGIGTDGRDGTTDAAGAWIDVDTLSRLGNDPSSEIHKYLNNNNSHNFFKKYGRLIHTGHTGTNVMDVFLFFFG